MGDQSTLIYSQQDGRAEGEEDEFEKEKEKEAYMQKTCDVAEMAILAKKNLRKKCVNRDKM